VRRVAVAAGWSAPHSGESKNKRKGSSAIIISCAAHARVCKKTGGKIRNRGCDKGLMDTGRFAGGLSMPTVECVLDGCDATHQKWLPDAFMPDAAHCLLLGASITAVRRDSAGCKHTHGTVFMHYLERANGAFTRSFASSAHSRQCAGAKKAQNLNTPARSRDQWSGANSVSTSLCRGATRFARTLRQQLTYIANLLTNSPRKGEIQLQK
jgi:hypothetical protein